jgi:sugar phosphate isomerase/epimerase
MTASNHDIMPLRVSVSELTMLRWDLCEELDHLAWHRLGAVSLWRTKLSDIGLVEARRLIERSGIRVSSLKWAGGFTGSDGRTFRESVADAREAIDTAAAMGAEVLVIHTGCRGGHTLGHAHRIVHEAFDSIVPMAVDRGVTLAIEPLHQAGAPGCGFMNRLSRAVEWVEAYDHPAVRIALDLWQFGHDATLAGLLPVLVPRLALVKVADRVGSPAVDRERLMPGKGEMPLDALLADLLRLGYRGDVEFEVVGEVMEADGYDHVLRQIRAVADGWSRRAGRPAARAEVSLPQGR